MTDENHGLAVSQADEWVHRLGHGPGPGAERVVRPGARRVSIGIIAAA